MIRTIDFNSLAAGTVVDDEYAAMGVSVSSVGGSGKAMIFDSANPTGDDADLASETLKGLLIGSEDGDSSDPDASAGGCSLFFNFDDCVQMKSVTFKDIDETTDPGTRMIFYGQDGSVIDNQFVGPTEDGGEKTVLLNVMGVSKLEVVLQGSGAIDNVTFIDDATDDGWTDDKEVDWTDDCGNDGLIANNDVLTMDEDTSASVDVLANDSDPKGHTLTVTSATSTNGTVSIGDKGVLTFTPDANYNGPATIDYLVDDGQGNTAFATVHVTVKPVNDAPVAEDDTAETLQDYAVIIPVLANDSDVDGDPLTITSATSPNGTVAINDNGTITFTPTEGFIGDAAISYTVSDPTGATDDANVTVTVTAGDGSPVAQDDDAETDEDTPVTIPVLANDFDPEGDPLTVTTATSPDGTVDINDDGTITFTPNENFNGPTTITYTIDDGNGNTDTGTVDVTVNPVNDAPVAVDDTASTDFATPVVIPVLANDSDVDGDPLTVTAATSPNGTVAINDDGTLTFTPNDDFTGDATINYTVSDPDGLTDDAVVTVAVGEDPAPPTRDGYVDGTPGGDLIDTAYTGDPDGDRIDNSDALLPGAAPNDDFVRAGDGDDTVNAGLGNDVVQGGAGDDVLNGQEGDDTIEGGVGSDTVTGGAGNDVIDTSNGDLAPDLGYPTAPIDAVTGLPTDPLGYAPDADPENDRDYVEGGDGNDTIRTGDDRDTILGGAGDDVINAGIDDDDVQGNDGNDRIVGGEGNDNILGGDGDDTIYAGNDPVLGLDVLDITDEPSDNPFSPDREPGNGRDTVDGGAGNDVIYGADDDDSLSGGAGNDYVDGQIDDDSISGGTGEDTLIGGQGDDTLRGNRDDDLLEGGDGDDLLDGGGENDTLMGGDGDDTLVGGQGDDLLDGGAGIDIMSGGAGQDTFVNVNAGDQVDGGSAPIDYDTLDLRGSAPEGGRLEVTYTSDDREDGFVTYYDDANEVFGSPLNFVEIENVIPCFTPGTRIATPKGERRVEELQVGDRVITRDNGIQTIRWVGARDMAGAELERAPHLKPVLIRQGALGNDLPERDMMVSPNHRVLVANDKTALYFEEREVLVAAKHLTGLEGVDIVDVSNTTYIHLMFDQHEVILSDGTWTESFQPGDQTLAGIGDAQRDEILELFPELATREGIDGYTAARRSLKKHEAQLLTM